MKYKTIMALIFLIISLTACTNLITPGPTPGAEILESENISMNLTDFNFFASQVYTQGYEKALADIRYTLIDTSQVSLPMTNADPIILITIGRCQVLAQEAMEQQTP